MYSDFIQGVLLSFLLFGSWNYVVKPNLSLSMLTKGLEILSETFKDTSSLLKVTKEESRIKLDAIGYNFWIPLLVSSHLFDIVCYKDAEHTQSVEFTYFAYKKDYAYIPFKPRDVSAEKIYLGIKYLTKEDYIFYEVEKDQFVDLSSYVVKYEEDIKVPVETELAEAYD